MIRKSTTEAGGEGYWFFCQGCGCHHRYITKLGRGETGPCWKFDGNLKSPTFSPSLLCNPQIKGLCSCPNQDDCENDAHAKPDYGYHRCHLFLRAGQVQFLGDCTHALAGQILPMEAPRF